MKNEIAEQALSGQGIDQTSALDLVRMPDDELLSLFKLSDQVRKKFFGSRIHLCAIMNARSGRCREDCKFCAQSAHYHTDIQEYNLAAPGEMVEAARAAAQNSAASFGIVTSGKGWPPEMEKEKEKESIISAVQEIHEKTGVRVCASLGIVDEGFLVRLKAAGLWRYHHNLECAESFWDRVCTTHAWAEDYQTAARVKAAGLELCCGGLFGMGETWEQRIELALILRELNADSVPINFLSPIPGTPLENASGPSPVECLKIIALYRLMLPRTNLQICGGREKNLHDLQSWMFAAGASGMMIGDYLTTAGRPVQRDLRMLSDLGLTWK